MVLEMFVYSPYNHLMRLVARGLIVCLFFFFLHFN